MSFDIAERYCIKHALKFQRNKEMFLASFLVKIQYCGDLLSPRRTELGLKPHSFDLQSTTSQANSVGVDQTYIIDQYIYLLIN